MDFVLAHIAVIAGIVWFGVYWKRVLRHEIYLQGLCLGLPPGNYRRLKEDSNALRRYSYESNFTGRQFRVEYRFGTVHAARFWRWKAVDELEIQLPVVQKFWLRVLPRKGALEEPPTTAQVEFDPAFLAHSNQPEAAREFLQSRFVREQFQGLHVLFDRMEIHRGWLKLQVSPSRIHFRRSDLERSLEVLTRLALDYTERSLRFRVVITGASELCPYCRGSLSGAQEPVVECRQCSTRVHGVCWRENGQCTTWGCESTAAG